MMMRCHLFGGVLVDEVEPNAKPNECQDISFVSKGITVARATLRNGVLYFCASTVGLHFGRMRAHYATLISSAVHAFGISLTD